MFQKAAKGLAYAVCWLLTAPLWLPERAFRKMLRRDMALIGQSQLLSLVPGKAGCLLRNAYYTMVLESCPLHVCLQFGSLFACSRVRVGVSVYLGIHSKVGLVDIGDGTIISDDVQLLSGGRQHAAPNSLEDFHAQPTVPQRIRIGRNCWVGTRAIVMADIGDNCLIGAGAVVTRPIPPNSVAMGIPARVVRAVRDRPLSEPESANPAVSAA